MQTEEVQPMSREDKASPVWMALGVEMIIGIVFAIVASLYHLHGIGLLKPTALIMFLCVIISALFGIAVIEWRDALRQGAYLIGIALLQLVIFVALVFIVAFHGLGYL